MSHKKLTRIRTKLLGFGLATVLAIGAGFINQPKVAKLWKHLEAKYSPTEQIQSEEAPPKKGTDEQTKNPQYGEITKLKNSGYQVIYSEGLKTPIQVVYVLDWNKKNPKRLKRPKIPFETDDRTQSRVSTQEYTGSGYSRGHMAPSFAIGAFHDREAQLQTFLLSNICPQTQDCNGGVWNSIERMEADDFAKRFQKIVVSDGPVFEKIPPDRLPTGIAIPTGFYKIIKRTDGQTIAFLVPQFPKSPTPESYLTSPENIEALTGLSFGLSPEENRRTRTKIW